MKKLILLGQITVLVMLFANVSYASGGRGHGHGHHRHHGNDYNQQGNYYGPPPHQVYRDGRSHQGLAGGVVGSVLGL
jgi:hypothetical protein